MAKTFYYSSLKCIFKFRTHPLLPVQHPLHVRERLGPRASHSLWRLGTSPPARHNSRLCITGPLPRLPSPPARHTRRLCFTRRPARHSSRKVRYTGRLRLTGPPATGLQGTSAPASFSGHQGSFIRQVPCTSTLMGHSLNDVPRGSIPKALPPFREVSSDDLIPPLFFWISIRLPLFPAIGSDFRRGVGETPD